MPDLWGDCPECGHPLKRDVHSLEDGCTFGWAYDQNGFATTDGCDCPLTIARYA